MIPQILTRNNGGSDAFKKILFRQMRQANPKKCVLEKWKTNKIKQLTKKILGNILNILQ